MKQTSKVIAIMPWSNEIEDFLAPLGLDLDAFCTRMTDGWLFGTVKALQEQGWRVLVICVSSKTDQPTRRVHLPTGASIIFLPSTRLYRTLRSRARDPYGVSSLAAFGPHKGLNRIIYGGLRVALPYFATPIRSLRAALSKEQCQTILVQEYEYARFDVVALLSLVINLRLFATFQGGDHSFSWFERVVRPWTIRRAIGLVVGSAKEAERVRTRYGVSASRIIRSPNPIDLSTWKRRDRLEMRQRLNLPAESRVAIFHGRIAIQAKGLDILLAAWTLVEAARPSRDVRLIIVGDGPDSDEFASRISANSAAKITWRREYVLDRSELSQILCAADIYVMASRQEGFPVAPLEAMACGLPVVATAASGLTEIVEEARSPIGRLVPQGDHAALALKLGELLDNPSLTGVLGNAARTEAENTYSTEAVGRRLDRAFHPE